MVADRINVIIGEFSGEDGRKRLTEEIKKKAEQAKEVGFIVNYSQTSSQCIKNKKTNVDPLFFKHLMDSDLTRK